MSLRNRIATSLFLGLAAIASTPTQASPASPPANSIYVSNASGNDGNTGLTPATAVKSINVGVSLAFDKLATTVGSADNAGSWTLFDAACRWADQPAGGVVAAPTNKCLFITRTMNISNRTSDQVVFRHLKKLGYDVQIAADSMIAGATPIVTSTTIEAMHLIVISQNIQSDANLNNLRASAVPKVNMRATTWGSFGVVAATGTPGTFVTQPVGTSVTVSNIATFNSAAGNAITAGDQTVYSKSYGFSAVDSATNAPIAGAVTVANVTGAPTQPCIIAADAGIALDPTAVTAGAPANNPARFVGFFLFALRPAGAAAAQASDWTDANTLTGAPQTVVVEADTYPVSSGLSPFRFLTVQGGWNAAFDDQTSTRTTTIDGQLKTRLIYAYNGAPSTYLITANPGSQNSDTGNPERSLCDASVLDGFVFTRGSAQPQGGSTALAISFGGGSIWVEGNPTNVTVKNSSFTNSTALDRGGVIFATTSFAQNTTISTTAFNNINFQRCTFSGNTTTGTATSNNTQQFGSILGQNGGPGVTFNRCLIDNNPVNADQTNGAVIACQAGGARNTTITNCIFSNNVCAGTNSRLIHLNGGEGATRNITLRNNTFYNNSVTSHLILFANNSNNPKFVEISNNIILNNTTTGANAAVIARSLFTTPTADTFSAFNNLSFGNTGFAGAAFVSSATTMGDMSINGTPNPADPTTPNVISRDNIYVDPLLVNAAGGDFHLTSLSPAFNTGFTTATDLWPADYDAISRPQYGAYDIGAFELPRPADNAVLHWSIY